MHALILIASFVCNGVNVEIHEERDEHGHRYWRTNQPGIGMEYERTPAHTERYPGTIEQLRAHVVQGYQVTHQCVPPSI